MSDETVVESNVDEKSVPRMRRILERHPRGLVVGWSAVVLGFVTLSAVALLCWYVLPLQLWNWANAIWWHWIPAVFVFILLLMIPMWGTFGACSLASFVADLSLSIEDAAVQRAQQTVRETEQEAISRFEQADEAGLLELLKYSRAQLEAYYTVGLSQTRKSFFNSVLAMWLGFLILLVGVALYVGPFEKIGLKAPTQDFRVLIMGGTTIIEFISALFLLVYRSSTAQLTYFYNRQMHTHTSILCFRIASTMDNPMANETKKAIVEKVLDWSSFPERQPLLGVRRLRDFIPKGERRVAS